MYAHINKFKNNKMYVTIEKNIQTMLTFRLTHAVTCNKKFTYIHFIVRLTLCRAVLPSDAI